uniref:Uncharacterized protein n=1 Tax=Cacopsylla melanoneura TaxID=428564 RepID=A0A8D8LEQ6_9HEMI
MEEKGRVETLDNKNKELEDMKNKVGGEKEKAKNRKRKEEEWKIRRGNMKNGRYGEKGKRYKGRERGEEGRGMEDKCVVKREKKDREEWKKGDVKGRRKEKKEDVWKISMW